MSYVNASRVSLTQTLSKVYNPASVTEHPAPWPMRNTNYDKDLKNIWCPDCGNLIPNNVPDMKIFTENYMCPEMSLPNRFY